MCVQACTCDRCMGMGVCVSVRGVCGCVCVGGCIMCGCVCIVGCMWVSYVGGVCMWVCVREVYCEGAYVGGWGVGSVYVGVCVCMCVVGMYM